MSYSLRLLRWRRIHVDRECYVGYRAVLNRDLALRLSKHNVGHTHNRCVDFISARRDAFHQEASAGVDRRWSQVAIAFTILNEGDGEPRTAGQRAILDFHNSSNCRGSITQDHPYARQLFAFLDRYAVRHDYAITLDAARTAVKQDWRAAYRKYVAPDPSLVPRGMESEEEEVVE